jgi:hypothetical protein
MRCITPLIAVAVVFWEARAGPSGSGGTRGFGERTRGSR